MQTADGSGHQILDGYHRGGDWTSIGKSEGDRHRLTGADHGWAHRLGDRYIRGAIIVAVDTGYDAIGGQAGDEKVRIVITVNVTPGGYAQIHGGQIGWKGDKAARIIFVERGEEAFDRILATDQQVKITIVIKVRPVGSAI